MGDTLVLNMETQQKFCLKWNQFHRNLKDVFKEMRDGQELFDVTLACADGTYLEAHRIVLAACSTFFRNVFKINDHSHPWIFLKGIRGGDLTAVVDFMYQGEVNVPQNDLSQFLVVAEDLQVKGLSGYGGMSCAGNEDLDVEEQRNYGEAMKKERNFNWQTKIE